MPERVRFTLDGRPAEADGGTSLLAALWNAGRRAVRTSVSGEARGPVCGMGTCFECRVTIDGEPHRRACLETVREGMEVRAGPVRRRGSVWTGTRNPQSQRRRTRPCTGAPRGDRRSRSSSWAADRRESRRPSTPRRPARARCSSTSRRGPAARSGGASAPPAAREWLARLARSGATVLAGATVVDAPEPNELLVERDGLPIRVRYERLVLATGARELLPPLPGLDASGRRRRGRGPGAAEGRGPLRGPPRRRGRLGAAPPRGGGRVEAGGGAHRGDRRAGAPLPARRVRRGPLAPAPQDRRGPRLRGDASRRPLPHGHVGPRGARRREAPFRWSWAARGRASRGSATSWPAASASFRTWSCRASSAARRRPTASSWTRRSARAGTASSRRASCAGSRASSTLSPPARSPASPPPGARRRRRSPGGAPRETAFAGRLARAFALRDELAVPRPPRHDRLPLRGRAARPPRRGRLVARGEAAHARRHGRLSGPRVRRGARPPPRLHARPCAPAARARSRRRAARERKAKRYPCRHEVARRPPRDHDPLQAGLLRGRRPPGEAGGRARPRRLHRRRGPRVARRGRLALVRREEGGAAALPRGARRARAARGRRRRAHHGRRDPPRRAGRRRGLRGPHGPAALRLQGRLARDPRALRRGHRRDPAPLHALQQPDRLRDRRRPRADGRPRACRSRTSWR